MKNNELLKISSLSSEEVFKNFNTSQDGLSNQEVKKISYSWFECY
ncbi:hypothetical protein [Candidatus Phytoplasma sp. AldY-WA1]|nr:hypothetical protein [Candidatus Phytoplasma sp. AldY-WA1]